MVEKVAVKSPAAWRICRDQHRQALGSLSFLTYDIDPTHKDVQPATVEFEISPVVTDLDGDGHPEILAIASDKNIFGSLAISPGVKKSWLAVFRYQNGRFESGKLGDELGQTASGLDRSSTTCVACSHRAGKPHGRRSQQPFACLFLVTVNKFI
jgi:hypothetical protein